MRPIRHAIVVLVILAAGCAATLPPPDTFSADRWARVERLTPGTWVQVRYLYGDPLMRHTFEGELRSVGRDVLELATRDGMQRLLPQRVLRVAIGRKEGSRAFPAAASGAVLGAVLGGIWAGRFEGAGASGALLLGLVGAGIGLNLGMRKEKAPAIVVYTRSGSL